MKALVLRSDETRDALQRLSQFPFGTELTLVSDCIDDLFHALGHEDIGECIAESIEQALLTEEQGRWLLGVAVWCGETNGAELQGTLERWLLESTDSLRVRLALSHDVLPFKTFQEMATVLKDVVRRLPEYEAQCRQLIEKRARQQV